LSVISWVPVGRRWTESVAAIGPDRLLAAAIATLLDGLSTRARLADFAPLDLSALARRHCNAFDRSAASEAKREMVLQTASRLFNQKGIDSTSLEEIAAQVGATKRTVYHHLGNKRALVMACHERAYRILFCIIDRMNEYSGPRAQALVAAMHALALVTHNEELTPLSPLVGWASLTPPSRTRMHEQGLRLAEQYRSLIRRGISEGSIREVDVEPRSLMLAGMTSWLAKEDLPSDPARRRQIAQEIANLVAAGISRPAGATLS
jgi:AcrR family transcriptional regulator